MTEIGVGSCGVSLYDTFPLTKKLLQKVEKACDKFLDLGCADGMYLVEFCKQLPEISAVGVEIDEGNCSAAKKLINENSLQNRIEIVNDSAQNFLSSNAIEFIPDFTVLSFVLHEILGQDGLQSVKDFLRLIIEAFPNIYLVVIEVDYQIDSLQLSLLWSFEILLQSLLSTSFNN